MKRPEPLALPAAIDENGVPRTGWPTRQGTGALSHWYYAETVPTPTDEELHDAAHHAQELVESQQRQLDAHAAGLEVPVEDSHSEIRAGY